MKSRSDSFRHHVLTAMPITTAAPLFGTVSSGIKPRRRRGGPDRERALIAIDALWPGGIPDKSLLKNCDLCRDVAGWLEEKNLPNVKDLTILRAAKRRHD